MRSCTRRVLIIFVSLYAYHTRLVNILNIILHIVVLENTLPNNYFRKLTPAVKKTFEKQKL